MKTLTYNKIPNSKAESLGSIHPSGHGNNMRSLIYLLPIIKCDSESDSPASSSHYDVSGNAHSKAAQSWVGRGEAELKWE